MQRQKMAGKWRKVMYLEGTDETLVGIGERKCGLRIREPCLRGKAREKEVSPMGEWLHGSPQNSA